MHTVVFPDIAPHERNEYSKNVKKNELCSTLPGDIIQFKYLVGGGGGHYLYIDQFTAEVIYSDDDAGSSSNDNNNDNNVEQAPEEEEDPFLSIFAGFFTIWEKKGQYASWEKLAHTLELSRGGKLKIGENQIKSIMVIPDGESISIGWNYFNEDGSENTTQGEITLTFGANRGYYWTEDISTDNVTFDGWVQRQGDVKSDFRGILINLESWEYLSLVPDSISPVVPAEEEPVLSEEEIAERKMQEEEDAIDYYVKYLDEIKENLLAFEAFVRRDSIHWLEEGVRESWIESVKASTTSFELASHILTFVGKIDSQVFTWVNGEHPDHTPKLKDPIVKAQDLARTLASIELGISWSGVVDDFKEARSAWTSNVFPISMKLKNINNAELALATYKKSLTDLLGYMIPDAMKWISEDEKYTWITSVSIVDTPVDIANLTAQFAIRIKGEYLTRAWDEENDNYLKLVNALEGITVYEISEVLLALERNIRWSGVLQVFHQKRNEWIHPLKELSEYGAEQKLYALGDITSKEIGLKMVKDALIDMESYLKRESIDWYLDEEKDTWINDVRSANSAESLARLLIKFVTKIKSESIGGGWDRGHHPVHSQSLLARRVKVQDLAAILLSIEVSIPWSAVNDIFPTARDEWRFPLTQLDNAHRQNTPYKSVLTVLKNSLVALENYLVRNVAKWASNDERKAWKEAVSSANSLSEFGNLLAQFIKIIKKDTFSDYNITALEDFVVKVSSPTVKIQTLLQTLSGIEQNIPWSAVTPLFQNDRSNWLNGLVNLPQYSWPDDVEEEELIGADKLENSPALRASSLVRSSVKQANEAKKNGLLNFAAPEKSTLELIANGTFRAYSFPTVLQEGDKISSVFHLQSFPNEDLEFDMNLLSSAGPILRIKFVRAAHSKGLVVCYLRNEAGEFVAIEGATSNNWNDSFPFSPSQDFEVVARVIDNNTISLVFDDVFTIPNISLQNRTVDSIMRICLAGKSGRILSKSVKFAFNRVSTLIPE